MSSIPGSDKKIICGILAITLGLMGVPGIHKFILGYTAAGLVMLLCTILTCWMLWPIFGIISLIEGILYLTKSDEEFVATYIDGDRSWF